MLDAAFALAAEIASKSPVAVQGTKVNLIYSRNHSVEEGLDYMVRPCLTNHSPSLILSATNQGPLWVGSTDPFFDSLTVLVPFRSLHSIQSSWNMAMLQTNDIVKSVQATMEKKDLKSVTFSKL